MVFDKIFTSFRSSSSIRKLDRISEREFDFKDIKFPVKIRSIHRIRVTSGLAFLVMKTRENIQSICQEVLSKNVLIYYCYKKKTKDAMFLSKISIHSGMIIHYTMEKNIFFVIAHKLLVQKKY